MPRKRFKTEEIIQKLREAEVLLMRRRQLSPSASGPAHPSSVRADSESPRQRRRVAELIGTGREFVETEKRGQR